MVEWFHERYISRVEHQEIVHYYRKLVARLHGQVRELRTQAEVPVQAPAVAAEVPPAKRVMELAMRRSAVAAAVASAGNVIRLDAHRRR